MQRKIIRPKQLAHELGISSTSLWRMEKRGELPPRIQISGQLVGWLESDITAFLESKRVGGSRD